MIEDVCVNKGHIKENGIVVDGKNYTINFTGSYQRFLHELLLTKEFQRDYVRSKLPNNIRIYAAEITIYDN